VKRPFDWMRILLLIARIAFGVLFLCASFGKIVDTDRFARQVANYDIIGPQASAIVGATLPWSEFIVGSCLLVGICKAGAWLGTILMFGCFLFARAWVVHRGLSIECGCGVMDGTITARSVIMSAALLLTAIVAYVATIRLTGRAHPALHAQTPDRRQSPAFADDRNLAEASICA